jgi:O-antigen/teichoic acid export membrane protein
MNGIIKKTAQLFTGASLATIISFALTPVLTRIFTPTEFGLGEMVNLYSVMLSMLFVMRLDQALLLPKDVKERVGILATIATNNICFSILTALIIGAIVLLDLAGPIYLLLPINILAISTFETMIWLLNAKQQYVSMAKMKVVMVSLTIGLKILLGKLGLGASALVLATIIAQLSLGLTILIKNVKWSEIKSFTGSSFYLQYLVKYKSFPKHILPTAIIGLVSEATLGFLLINYFTPGLAGIYALAKKLLSAPINTLGNSLSNSIYESLINEDNQAQKEKILTLFFKICCGLILAMVIGNMLAPRIIPILFGEKWLQASNFILALSPLYFMKFVFATVDKIVVLNKTQKSLLNYKLSTEIIGIISLFIAVYLEFSVYLAISIYSLIVIVPRVYFLSTKLKSSSFAIRPK